MRVATPKTDEQLQLEAQTIADIVALTKVDQRKKLFELTSNALGNRMQHWTARLFIAIAERS